MSNTVKIISWIMLVIALASWAGVGYAAHVIKATAIKRANDTKLAQTKANQAVLNQKVEALAESTKEKRDQLSAIAGADVVSIIDVIDAAGKTAGIEARVSDASVAGQQQLGKTGDTLRGVAFNVQGTGTFVQVMHAAELYEKLPILSSIDSIDIEKVQGSDPKTANLWHISARIRVQTLITVSI
jgi:hypothetical protein